MHSRRYMPFMLGTVLLVASGLLDVAMPETTRKLPGQSIADSRLQLDTIELVVLRENLADKTCTHRKIINTEVTEFPKNPRTDSWTERWTVDRCGKLVYYKIIYTPDPRGGTNFTVDPAVK